MLRNIIAAALFLALTWGAFMAVAWLAGGGGPGL